MRIRTLAAWPALLTLVVLIGTGCHPGEISEVEELDVVITFYDQETDFGAYATFAMEDTIYNLAVLQDPGLDDELDRRHDDDIIAQVKSELQARGYALVDTSEVHDLRVGLGAMTKEGTLLYSYFPWWGYYPGHWYPSWGSVDFTKGTLLVFLVDWQGRDEEAEEVDPIWVGGLDGVLEGASSLGPRLESGIGQMFVQSPYLRAGDKSASGEVR